MNNKIISIPVLNNYNYLIKYLIEHTTKYKVISSESITSKTIELGNKYSPKYASNIFKYNLGSMIESLENGSNIIIQIDDGYYSEIQEKILADLGYLFKIYYFKFNFISIWKLLKNIDSNISIFKKFYYIFIILINKKRID